MKDNVKERFDTLAKDYDQRRRAVIPCFDAFYGAGLDFLDFDGEAPKVLDIGAGTGLFAAMLIERYPKAELTLIDFSEEMLGLARERFADRENTRYLTDNYITREFDQSFDIIISALSIHHLNAAEKEAFYLKIFFMLNEGGEFVNADEIISEYPSIQKKYEENWIGFMKGGGATEEMLAEFRKSVSLDDPSTVGDQLAWMKAAGFALADCIFKSGNFAVLYGKK